MVKKINFLSVTPIFLTIFITTHAATPEVDPKIPMKKSQTSGIHFHIEVKNHQDAHSNSATAVYTHQLTKQPDSTAKDSIILNKVSELWQENKKIQQQLKEQSSSFLDANKWYLLAAGLACSYGFLAYWIMNGNSYLGETCLWSSWHQELPLDQLLAIPQPQITHELITEIQRRYTDSSSIADIVKPLGIFMVKIDQEEEQIKWYQTVYSWLSYTKLNKLVPASQARFAKIPERLQRIAYYKNIFKTWAADYQLQQSERFWYRCPEKGYPGIPEMAQLLQIEMAAKTLAYWEKQKKRWIPHAG